MVGDICRVLRRSGCGVSGCCKGDNSDCCRFDIIKCFPVGGCVGSIGGNYGGDSLFKGVL